MYTDETFGLRFSNIPTVNLRLEFNRTYGFIFGAEAEFALQGPLQPIRAPMFVWGGMSEDMFTLLLQRSILGVEAYLPAALIYAAAQLQRPKELFAKLRDPFSFGAKLAVTNLYDRMPSAVHPELSLRYQDQALYDRTVAFYRNVRNPLFHGSQLTREGGINAIRSAFEHLARVYEWIDHWHDPELRMKGLGSVVGVRDRHPRRDVA